MNLHEECLIKYLTNPIDLLRSTELLKINTILMKEEILKSKEENLNLSAYSDLAYNN